MPCRLPDTLGLGAFIQTHSTQRSPRLSGHTGDDGLRLRLNLKNLPAAKCQGQMRAFAGPPEFAFAWLMASYSTAGATSHFCEVRTTTTVEARATFRPYSTVAAGPLRDARSDLSMDSARSLTALISDSICFPPSSSLKPAISESPFRLLFPPSQQPRQDRCLRMSDAPARAAEPAAAAAGPAPQTPSPTGEEATHAAAEIEAASEPGPEDEFDPEESYETGSSASTSVNSSIYAHTFERGRRYHHYKNGRYPIPNDDMVESQVTVALARRAMEDHSVHRYFTYYFWFAQKPET